MAHFGKTKRRERLLLPGWEEYMSMLLCFFWSGLMISHPQPVLSLKPSVRYICSSGLWELCNLPVKHHIQFWSYTALPHVDMKGKKGKKGKKAEHGVKKVENDYVWIKLFSLELGCGFVHFWMQSRRPINLHCRCAFSLFWISWSYSLSISLQCFNNCSQYWSHFSHILHLFY